MHLGKHQKSAGFHHQCKYQSTFVLVSALGYQLDLLFVCNHSRLPILPTRYPLHTKRNIILLCIYILPTNEPVDDFFNYIPL